VEAEVIKALGFKQFDYLIDIVHVDVPTRLWCDVDLA
jgi:hypothetical protein